MEYIKLIGIVIVVAGFALKKDSILIIMLAALATALVGGIGIIELIEILGTAFYSNRSMEIFILVFLVTGTLERNGLKEAAANLIGKVKGASPGAVIGSYGVLRGFLGSFNVGLGSHAGFVRPVIMPMATSAIEGKTNGEPVNEDHVEAIKGMSAAVENITWFFCQVLFVGGSGAILVQTTLANLGYEVELLDLAAAELPVALFAVALTAVVFYLKDRSLTKKYYGSSQKSK